MLTKFTKMCKFLPQETWFHGTQGHHHLYKDPAKENSCLKINEK